MDDVFFRLELRVDPHLVGAKRAVRIGAGPILISPAMHDLITHASGGELKTILKAIEVQVIPDPRVDVYSYVPLLTCSERDFRR